MIRNSTIERRFEYVILRPSHVTARQNCLLSNHDPRKRVQYTSVRATPRQQLTMVIRTSLYLSERDRLGGIWSQDSHIDCTN